jgi:adenylate cyclase
MHFNKPFRTFPLRTTLVVSVMTTALIIILMIFVVVGLPAYGKAKNAIRNLWQDIAEQVAFSASEQMLRYFQNGPITLKVIEGLVQEKQLQIDNLETIFDICYRTLRENPEFLTVEYFKNDGTFYGVFRIAGGYEASHRVIDPDGKTAIVNYKIGEGNKWVQTATVTGDYDPRKRPFWKTAMEHPEGGWTDPYRFATTGLQGYTYVLGQKGKDGFWAVDYEVDHLSDFLRTLKIGQEGLVYILAEDGTVMAESSKHDNKTIDEAWNQYLKSGQKEGFFSIKDRIFYANRFPEKYQIPWTVVTSIHEDDFLKPIRRDALISLLYGLIPCVLFLALIAVFFGRVSGRMKEIAWEMDEIGNLAFRVRPETRLSRIREVNAMNHALHKMKVALQSFAKYIPVDLIKKLIFSGRAAELGAEKKEVTVFFADMAGFTSMAENLQPQEVVEIMEEFLTGASQEIHREKGIIDKFMGDAVMALWGVPDPVVNPALAACRTALAIKKRFASTPHMKHRIGINTGFAMVGNFGSEERLDYTAIGDTVNIAARLEKFNKQYGTQILLGPQTAAAVQEVMLVRPLNWVMLDGRTHELLAYELLGEKQGMAENIVQAVAAYEQGLDAFQKQHYREAAGLFEKANALFGGADVPSKMLMDLAKQKS